jgi:hypothetical protein
MPGAARAADPELVTGFATVPVADMTAAGGPVVPVLVNGTLPVPAAPGVASSALPELVTVFVTVPVPFRLAVDSPAVPLLVNGTATVPDTPSAARPALPVLVNVVGTRAIQMPFAESPDELMAISFVQVRLVESETPW